MSHSNTNASAVSSAELEKKYGKTAEDLFSRAKYRHEAAEQVAFSDYSYWKSVWKIFISKKRVKVLIVLFLFLVVFSFIAEAISPYEYATLHSDFSAIFQRPNSQYWFGTDNLGRDYWVQVWSATLISIKLSGMVAIGECVIGVIMGCVWGYVRSLDRFFTELYNLINNIPSIIYMTLIALFVGQSLATLTISMIAVGWLHNAKQIRGLVFLYRDREFNLASRCLGTKTGTVIRKNLIPYLVSVIFLSFSMSIPGTIGMETTLSYLGLGLGVDTPSLGILLRNAPLHPYTRALMSAAPSPDPAYEKKKKPLIFDYGMLRYQSGDRADWCEVCPGHYVYGSEKEIDGYRAVAYIR